MKLLNEQEPKEFQPFTLSIRVETIEDLVTLWMRFNCSKNEIFNLHEDGQEHLALDVIKKSNDMVDSYHIWRFLDERLREYTKHSNMNCGSDV